MSKVTKTFAALLTAGLLSLSLVGCGSSSSTQSNSDSSGEQAKEEIAATEDNSSNKKDEKKDDKAANSDYAVTIDGARKVEGMDGEQLVAIDFTFTNVKHDEPQSMMLAAVVEAYQDGVQLEKSYFSEVDTSSNDTKVKAGSSVAVTQVFKLNSDSEVEVTVKEAFSWDNVVLAEKNITLE